MREHLDARLASLHSAGRKILVAYLTAGMAPNWTEMLQALAAGGADAIEIGLPFSDPMIDGPVIQRACVRAIAAGTTPQGVLSEVARLDIEVPLAVMTYYNLVFRAGHERMAGMMADAGVTGAIVPDLSLEESGPWCESADRHGIATVMLVAPSTPEERARLICDRSRAFVYAVGLMGVTGERAALAPSATAIGERLGPLTELPVCVGIGVSSPSQASQVSAHADGVIVGSAIVGRILDGAEPDEVAAFTASLRRGLDANARSAGA